MKIAPILLALFAATVTSPPLRAQGAPAPADAATPEALVEALYETVTRRPGQPFDWDRQRTLFMPGARLIPNTEQTGGTLQALSVDEFIAWIDRHTVVGGPGDGGFQEREIATRVERYGDVAHAFSTYEKGFYGSSEVLGRGINSIQMVRHDGRWWVTQIVWDEESGAGPIPGRYLPAKESTDTGVTAGFDEPATRSGA